MARRRSYLLAVCAAVLALTSACAGFRSGSMAAPYFVGTEPPSTQPGTIYEINQTRTLTRDGVALTITLGEDVRSSDVQVVLAVVPTSITLGDRARAAGDGDMTLTLDVQPGPRAVSILPGRVRITAKGQDLTPIGAALAGRSARILGLSEPVSVAAQGFASVTLRFDLPKDTAPEEILLDLSDALKRPIPLIRFKTLRWHYGYT